MNTENSLSEGATERVLAFLAQPEIALGDADELDLLLADPQFLRDKCEVQLDKVTNFSDDEIAAVRADFAFADWPFIARELRDRTRAADKFFEEDAEER
jgi:hypothetical protein